MKLRYTGCFRALARVCLLLGAFSASGNGYPTTETPGFITMATPEEETVIYQDSTTELSTVQKPGEIIAEFDQTELVSLTGEGVANWGDDEIDNNSSFGHGFAMGVGWVWVMSWTWWNIAQLITACVGFLANLTVILALLRRKSIHQSTDILILGLAIADLVTSMFNIPYPLGVRVPNTLMGRMYCKLVFPLTFKWLSIVASNYTLVIMSFERMCAVVYPLQFKSIFTKRRVYTSIIAVWIGSFVPNAYYFTFFVEDNGCRPGFPQSGVAIVTFTNVATRLLIPTILLVVSQTRMAISLHLQSKRLRAAIKSGFTDKKTYHIGARNRVIKMMIIVIAIYITTWSPAAIAWLFVGLGVLPQTYAYSNLHWILHLISIINSSVNPFIYASTYPKFRTAIKEIFVGVKEKNKPLFDPEVKSPILPGTHPQTN